MLITDLTTRVSIPLGICPWKLNNYIFPQVKSFYCIIMIIYLENLWYIHARIHAYTATYIRTYVLT